DGSGYCSDTSQGSALGGHPSDLSHTSHSRQNTGVCEYSTPPTGTSATGSAGSTAPKTFAALSSALPTIAKAKTSTFCSLQAISSANWPAPTAFAKRFATGRTSSTASSKTAALSSHSQVITTTRTSVRRSSAR